MSGKITVELTTEEAEWILRMCNRSIILAGHLMDPALKINLEKVNVLIDKIEEAKNEQSSSMS